MNLNLYTFIGWSVGTYHVNSHSVLRDGITLQFVDSSTGEHGFYAHFNVELHRKRKIGKKAAGTRLLKNKFRVKSIRCKFYKFWLRTLLPIPRRTNRKLNLSGFPDCMGKLKEVTFTANLISDKSKQLDKDTICKYLNSEDSLSNHSQQLPNNLPTTTQQLSDNFPTITSYKKIKESHIDHEFQHDSNACDYLCVNKDKVNREVCEEVSHGQVTKELNTPLNNYNFKHQQSSKLIRKHTSEIKHSEQGQKQKLYPGSAEYAQQETIRIQNQSQDEWLADYDKRDRELSQAGRAYIKAKEGEL